MSYTDPDKQRQFQRERVAQIRAEWFAKQSCSECGGGDDLTLVRRPDIEKATAKVWSWSAERREAELAKFIVVCRDCRSGQAKERERERRRASRPRRERKPRAARKLRKAREPKPRVGDPSRLSLSLRYKIDERVSRRIMESDLTAHDRKEPEHE